MATLWDLFAASYSSPSVIFKIRDNSGGNSFEEFADKSVESLSQSMASQDLGAPDSYLEYTSNQIGTALESILASCEDGTQRMEQLISKLPSNMQEATEFTINDMIERGDISSIYDLKTGAASTIFTYLGKFVDPATYDEYALCAHPLTRGASSSLLQSANSFMQPYIKTFALNFNFTYGLTDAQGFDSSQTSYKVYEMIPDGGGGFTPEFLLGGIPDPTGKGVFSHVILQDGDTALPTEILTKVEAFYKGELFYTSGDAVPISINLDNSNTPVLNATLPAGATGDAVEGVNTMNIMTLKDKIGATFDETVITAMNNNYGIFSLADVRKWGGLATLPGIPQGNQSQQDTIAIIDAHARLEPLTLIEPVSGPDPDPGSQSYYASQALIEGGITSAKEMAELPIGVVVKLAAQYTPASYNYGHLNAVNAYNRAKVQANLVANYVNGYITLGQKVMENLSDGTGMSTLTTSDPSTFLQELKAKCACSDCETALSPQAYLFELIDFISKNIKLDSSTFADHTELTSILHQPFEDLAGHCEDVDEKICQQRIAVEILRSAAGTLTGIEVVEKAYAETVHKFILNQFGTTLTEALSYKKQSPEKVKEYANRLGLYVNEAEVSDITVFFGMLLPDWETITNYEDVLEEMYGVRSTKSYQLSQGIVYGTHAGQIARWRLSGGEFLKNTSDEGKLFFEISSGVLNIYKADTATDNWVASGTIPSDSMVVPISEKNHSGLSGYVVLSATTDFALGDTSIRYFSESEARRFQYLYELFKQADFPQPTEPPTPVDEVAIDPDIVLPEDIRYPWLTSNRVFELWSARKAELSGKGDALQTIIDYSLPLDIEGTLSNVKGVAADLNGNIYAADYLAGNIKFSEIQPDTSYSALSVLPVSGPDTSMENAEALWFNHGTNQLLGSFNAALAADKKIAGYEISYSSGISATMAWRLKNLNISGYPDVDASHLRQDSEGNLIMTSNSQVLKYTLPREVYSDLISAQKPFFKPDGTLLVPDSQLGLVYQLAPQTGQVLQVYGQDVKSDIAIFLPFDETTGTTAQDDSGNNSPVNGTLKNQADFSTAAFPDYGVGFSADVAAYVGIPSNTRIDDRVSKEKTLEIWFKYDGGNPTDKNVIYREGTGSAGFIAYIDQGFLYCGYINTNIQAVSYYGVETNQWQQLVFVLNAPDGVNTEEYTFEAFLNGKNIGKILGAQIPVHATETAIGNIGDSGSSKWKDNSSATGNHLFSGIIHNFRVWNRVFSSEEVLDLYDSFGVNESVMQAPVAVFSNAASEVFVAENGLKYIHVFNAQGEYLRRFGGYNSNATSFVPGKFNDIKDITFSSSGLIFVLDGVQQIIQVFDESGSYQRAFGSGVPSPGSATVEYHALEFYKDKLYVLTKEGSATKAYVMDTYGNLVFISASVGSSITPVDITIKADEEKFAILYEEDSLAKVYLSKAETGASFDKWTLEGYETVENGSFVSGSPAIPRGIIYSTNGEMFVTDTYEFDPGPPAVDVSRVFGLKYPVVYTHPSGTIQGMTIDRQDRIYIATTGSDVLRLYPDLTVDTEFGDEGVLNITGLKDIVNDFLGHLYIVDGSTDDVSVYTEDGNLLYSGINDFNFDSTGFYYLNIGPDGRLIASGKVSSTELVRVIDPISNYGVLLNSVYNLLTSSEDTTLSYYDYTLLWWKEKQGLDISSDLENFYLSMPAYRYLEQIRSSVYQKVEATAEQWEYVKNILIYQYKRTQYKTWRDQEGLESPNEQITYSPYYFDYSSQRISSFKPVPFRSTVSSRANWEEKVAARYDQVRQMVQAQKNTLTESDDENLKALRDGIINLTTTVNGTSIEGDIRQKADLLQENLLYDFQYNCCQSTTRVATAIQTLQLFVEGARDNSFTTGTDTEIQVVHQDFGKRWPFMSSYESWRAATFIYLYPENLLQPGIKPVQSPKFREILQAINENPEFNSDTACEVTRQYSSYFEDICNLELVGASRLTEKGISEGECGAKYDSNYPNYNYLFGHAKNSGKLYYSVTEINPEARTHVDIRKMWTEVPNLEEYSIYEFCGVSNFRQALNLSWVYIFFKANNKDGVSVFGFQRFNTFTNEWDSKFTELNIGVVSDDEIRKLSIRTIYMPAMWIRPILGVLDSNFNFYKIGLTQDGTSLQEVDIKKENGKVIPYRSLEGNSRAVLLDVVDIAELAIGNSLYSPLLVVYGLAYWDKAEKREKIYQIRVARFNQNSETQYSAIFQYPEYKGFVIDKVNKELSVIVRKNKWMFSYLYTIDQFNTTPEYRKFPEQVNRVITPELNYPDDELFGFSYWSVTTSDKGQTIYGDGIYEIFHTFSSGTIGIDSQLKLTPANAKQQFRITPQLLTNDTDIAKLASSLLYSDNKGVGPKIREYIEEAFYYIPMLIAGKLQQKGFYQQALDWYRTVYNDPTNKYLRKIFYGLEADSNLAAKYDKATLFLADDINPHTVAITRPDAYTRYTAASIVNCLIDYADQEFTQDTAESVARADQLYNQAIKLLNEFRSGDAPVNACSTALNALDVTVSDPAWEPIWRGLVQRLGQIEDQSDLSGLIISITDIMNDGLADIADKLTDVEEVINVAIGQQQGIEQFDELKQISTRILFNAELYIASEKFSANNNAVAYAGYGSSGKNAMRYSTELIQNQATKEFEVYAGNAGRISSGTVLAQGDYTIPGLDDSFTPLPSGNVVELQAYNATPNDLHGTYTVPGPEWAATGINFAYDSTYPAAEQISIQQDAHDVKNTYTWSMKMIPVTMQLSTLVYCVPPNPVMDMLRSRAEINLYKIRNCRNIAGAVRELDPFSVPTDATSGMPVALNGTELFSSGALAAIRPTQYRYNFLIERAKILCNIAQQMEASMLSSLEKLDAESYAVLRADQDVALARQNVQLQNLRVSEAGKQITLAEKQVAKSVFQEGHFDDLVEKGLNNYEFEAIKFMTNGYLLLFLAGINFKASSAAAAGSVEVAKDPGTPFFREGEGLKTIGQALVSTANLLQTLAAYDRRREEWEFQRDLAANDVAIATVQLDIAKGNVQITKEEKRISELQAKYAEDAVNFLRNKFTNADLYAFMSNQLSNIYKYFLTQATSTARLAASQLSFERQQDYTQTIAGNYYTSPNAGQSTNPEQSDRKGLTGSARLLKDIYILESKAIDSNKRKLQVSKTISLASLDPVAFQQFRQTGFMAFTTTHEMFDKDFPGQYMRLINRVRTNVIALTSPVEGIKANLRSLGPSRVIVGSDFPQEVIMRREPEMVALTSAINAEGVFEMQQLAPEMYRPFENSGVAMNWVFELPRYTNRMNYDSIADVMVTIEYTAEYSDTLKEKVLKRLGNTFRAQRSLSMKLFYPDAWYDLYNPATGSNTLSFEFSVERDYFPPNMDNIRIKGISMFVQAKAQTDFPGEEKVLINSLSLDQNDGGEIKSNGQTSTISNLISTNFLTGTQWLSFVGNEPYGTWKVEIDNKTGIGINQIIKEDRLEDIIFVIEYSAELPPYNTF